MPEDWKSIVETVCLRRLGITMRQFTYLKDRGAFAFDGPCHSDLVLVEMLALSPDDATVSPVSEVH